MLTRHLVFQKGVKQMKVAHARRFKRQRMMWQVSYVVMKFKKALKKMVGAESMETRNRMRIQKALTFSGFLMDDAYRKRAILNWIVPVLNETRWRHEFKEASRKTHLCISKFQQSFLQQKRFNEFRLDYLRGLWAQHVNRVKMHCMGSNDKRDIEFLPMLLNINNVMVDKLLRNYID